MDEKEIVATLTESINSGIGKLGETLNAQVAQLNEKADKILTAKPEDVMTSKEVDAEIARRKAQMEANGLLGGVTNIEPWDIPIGQALVGGFTAVFASEIIDGFLINQADWMKGAVKLIGAGISVKWGGRILGSTGSKALALLLAYDGLRSFIPIDSWAKKGADTVTGMIPVGGLGGFKANAEKSSVGTGSNSYYKKLYGGA